MGALRQLLEAGQNRLKIDIQRSNKKLLFAAVILFGLFWSLFTPFLSVEEIAFEYYLKNKSKKETNLAKAASFSDKFLTSNSFLNTNSANLPNSANVLASASAQLEEGSYIIQDEPLEPPTLFQDTAFLTQGNPITFIAQDAREGTITYTVAPGDTASTIAASFGITTNTILWANNISSYSLIRPGDELIILPTTGILYRVRSGDTIGSIAKKYSAKTDDVIAFNSLPADGQIKIGNRLIIPDGSMPIPTTPKPSRTTSYAYGPGAGKSHAFPWGQCTWYVAQRRVVPWSGHAKSWIANAQAMGYSVCYGNTCAPQAGAIISTRENSWLSRLYGHVAYVEAVNGDWVTISEMNYYGLGVKTVRTIHRSDGRIRGYVY